MTIESIKIKIGGEIYYLRFSDTDVAEIEQQFKPIPVLFQPERFGFDVARVFLWKGLKNLQPDGTLVYAFSQNAQGFDDALRAVKTFTRDFEGAVVGVSLIYASVGRALVAAGWYAEKSNISESVESVQSDAPPKN